MNKVIILGINGHIGHHAAKAFVAAGWEVTGMGRSNKHPVAGVRFVKGDAESVEDMRAAIGDSEVVVNALNLPYHQWDKGRMEAQTERVIEAMGRGRTMLFPGNVYNYAKTYRVITPDMPQRPETPRGEIRVRTEALLEAAAKRGDMQVIILRAGDFFGPDNAGDWFDLVMMTEAAKGKIALMGTPGIGHAWAYLPDLGKAFEKLAWHRNELKAFERFNFEGHFETPETLRAAMLKASPRQMRISYFPRVLISMIGVVNPLMREIAKMGYLWTHPVELKDERLATLLGPDFSTPFDQAVAESMRKFFPAMQAAA
jgi:nucleoside-diphosphate-sugar epimerase